MLGDGFIDKNGNQLTTKDLFPFVLDEGKPQFYLKLIEETSHYITFEMYSVLSWGENPKTKKFDVPCDSGLYLTGSVKWDGCSHIWFGEEENGKQDSYLHLCGKHGYDELSQLLQELFEFASNQITNFDHDVAT